MVDSASESERFAWRLPLCLLAATVVVLVALILFHADATVLYLFIIGPTLFLICLVQLATAAIRKQPRRCLSWLFTIVAFLSLSWILIKNEAVLRPSLRWLLWSRRFKAEVLAQASRPTELKHVEWDGWGGAGNDTVVYLVFDPADLLAEAAKTHASGRFPGIPCEVPLIMRLERNWYSVTFYTDSGWNSCP